MALANSFACGRLRSFPTDELNLAIYHPSCSTVHPNIMPFVGLLDRRSPRSKPLILVMSPASSVGSWKISGVNRTATLLKSMILALMFSFCLSTDSLFGTMIVPLATCQARIIWLGVALYFFDNSTMRGSSRTVAYPTRDVVNNQYY